MLKRLPVCWQDLLDAHQTPVLHMGDAPFLRVDNGTLTAPGLLDDQERDRLVAIVAAADEQRQKRDEQQLEEQAEKIRAL